MLDVLVICLVIFEGVLVGLFDFMCDVVICFDVYVVCDVCWLLFFVLILWLGGISKIDEVDWV